MIGAIMIIALWVQVSLPAPEHAIYISVVEINHSSTGGSSMMIKVFSDDLADALRNFSAEVESMDQQVIQDYFDRYLTLTINGDQVKLNLRKIAIENDTHLISFGFASDLKWETLEVKGKYFMELFPTQINVFNIMYGDRKLFAKTTKTTPIQQVFID